MELEIKEEDIKSVIGLLQRMFPTLPHEYIEDAVSDKLLMMLEKNYKMNAGNLFALSKFALYKEIKKGEKVVSYDHKHALTKEEKDKDKYISLKDGSVDEIIRLTAKHMNVSERDMRIFTEATISRTPVHEIAKQENLAVSPTYRIIKRVKAKVQKVAHIVTED